jgi:hypothetical protein
MTIPSESTGRGGGVGEERGTHSPNRSNQGHITREIGVLPHAGQRARLMQASHHYSAGLSLSGHLQRRNRHIQGTFEAPSGTRRHPQAPRRQNSHQFPGLCAQNKPSATPAECHRWALSFMIGSEPGRPFQLSLPIARAWPALCTLMNHNNNLTRKETRSRANFWATSI